MEKHIVLLVSGTLFDAEQGVSFLKILGLADVVTGIGALFGSSRNALELVGKPKWVPLPEITGHWLLVIPEDTYAVFRNNLSSLTSGFTMVDGRATPKPIFGISKDALPQIVKLLSTT